MVRDGMAATTCRVSAPMRREVERRETPSNGDRPNMTTETPRLPIATAMLRDPRLSIEARGLLASLLTIADPRSISLTWIAMEYRFGRHKAERLVRELEYFGYCRRARPRTGAGTFGPSSFELTDEPARVGRHKRGLAHCAGFPRRRRARALDECRAAQS